VSEWTPKLGSRRAPLYVAIAEAMADDVAAGRLRPGERMPSHRLLAARMGIDLTTATRAYAEARRRGLIVAHSGRGTFVRTPSGGAPGPLARVVDLTLNGPPELEDGAGPNRAWGAVLGELAADAGFARLTGYGDPQGVSEHREAGAHWIAARALDAAPDRVIVTCGAQHAVAVVLASLGAAGRVVLAEGLTFPAMLPLARYLGAQLVGVTIDRHGLRPDALAAACREHRPVALCCVPTFQNPTVAVMPEARRAEIAAVARDHGLALVEDDAYGPIAADAPTPLSAYAPELSYYVASLSKSVAPGLRIAYVLAPDARRTRRVAAATGATVWMAAPLLGEIAARWVGDGTAATIIRARRDEGTARHSLATSILGPRLTVSHPHAYHAWIALPERWSSQAFAAAARLRGVAVTPSETFAVDPTFATAGVRVCFGSARTRADLADGLRILGRLLDDEPEHASILL